VNLPDGKKLRATKVGKIVISFKNYYSTEMVRLKNVYFVEGLQRNLLSVSKMSESSTIVVRDTNAKIYDKVSRKLLAVANKIDNLYYMIGNVERINNSCSIGSNEVFANVTKLTAKEKWHRALGHVNFQYLDKIVRDKLLDGLPDSLEKESMKCATCIESKMTNVPFENNRTKTKSVNEIIHTDLNGPHHIAGYKGEKYFLTFIDDYSKCARIYCLKNKSETAEIFKSHVNFVENQIGKPVRRLQCDKGTEYINKEIFEFASKKGIEILPCPTNVHELNGVAERYNRSAMDIARCLLKDARIDKMYWPEAISTAAYLKNRTVANTSENKTPFEIYFGIKPKASHLKIYGSRVFVDDKSQVGVLVGYSHFGYRVLINNKIIEARHVQVIEKGTKLICLQEEYKSPEYVNVKLNEYESESENYESENESENDYHNEVVYRNENVNNLSQNSVDDEEVFTNAQAEDRAADVSAQNKTRRASTREKKNRNVTVIRLRTVFM